MLPHHDIRSRALTGACVALFFAAGCAQIFGFDKEYATETDAGPFEPGAGGTGGSGTAATGGKGGNGAAGGGAGSISGGGGGDRVLSLIDDMEDGDEYILAADQRRGTWFWNNDTTGTQSPPVGADKNAIIDSLPLPRAGSLRGLHTSGENFTLWGANFGANLAEAGGAATAYDASEFTGITFWALGAQGTCRDLGVGVQDIHTHSSGGFCESCNDSFVTSLAVSDTWQQYTVPFSTLTQRGFGFPIPPDGLDTTKLYLVIFEFTRGCDFDIWIDDLAFYR